MTTVCPSRGAIPSSPWAGPRDSLFDAISCLAAMTALAAVAVAGTVAQSPTATDDAGPESARVRSDGRAAPTGEFMVAGYGGAPYTYASDVTVTRPGGESFTAKDVAWDGRPFVNPIYYGVRIARWFDGGRLGAMVDFTHSKALARLAEEKVFEGTLDGKPAPERAVLRTVFRRLEASHGHNMLTLNGLIRLPSLGFHLHPYAGLGAGITLPHAEVHVASDPARTYEYQYAGPVAQGLVGLELRTARVSYFLEYKFTFAPYEMALTHEDGHLLVTDLWRQLTRWWRGETPPGGTASTTFASHQAIAGVGVRFGATAPAR